jgi:short-subunit dehydrogenase involved in D-alanine esterification of teichoic acids
MLLSRGKCLIILMTMTLVLLPTDTVRIVSKYPNLDCVFLNSGKQSVIHLSKPAEVDLDAFHDEMNTNFSRLVDLSIKFLPHLQQKPFPTALVITGTNLAIVPAVLMPAYSASKAALNAFVYCLRRQIEGSNTKIIEIWPPAVQSKLAASRRLC